MSIFKKTAQFPCRTPRACQARGGLRTYAVRIPGFTLLEVLTVMAIMAILTALVAPAFTNLGKGNALMASGNKVANLFNSARQNSLSRNVMTALVMITDSNLPGRYQTFALLELTPPSNGAAPTTSNWRQISKWETLANGVIADPKWPSNPTQALTDSGQSLLPASMNLPSSLTCGGKTVSSYQYVVFLPAGGLFLNNFASFAQIQLVEGFLSQGSTSPVYTQPSSSPGGGPANYYRISALAATGNIKIDRP